MTRRDHGFTLVELMVSLAIFSVIALAGWQVTDRMITTKQALETKSQQLRQLQKSLWIIGRDLYAVADRPIRDNQGSTEAAFTSLVPGIALTFTRHGWQNPGNNRRSTLQRVAYSLEPDNHGANRLIRYYWPILDRGSDTTPVKQVLLDDVDFIELQFIDQHGIPHFYWPQAQAASENTPTPAIPSGVRLKVAVHRLGELERVYPVRDMELSQ